MSSFDIKVINEPTKEVRDQILQLLKEFNETKVGSYQSREFALCAYDHEDNFIGGMYGRLSWGWLYLDLAFVKEHWRGHGVGSRLMHECEALAKNNGIYHIRCNTGSFQAPDFYLKNGFEIFAQLEIYTPDGHKQTDFFLKKHLQ